MQTILGSSGAIGVELAKELTNYTDRIRLVSRNPKKVNPTDELFPADLSDRDQVFKAVEGSDVVYLTVGFDYNIKVWREKWPAMMRNAIDACKKWNAKLVFFDNLYLYGPDSVGHMTEETAVRPSSKKGQIRAEIAATLMNEARQGTITALIARAADFYGPNNDKSLLVETVVKNFQKGKAANWFVRTDKVHTFTYTPDAAKATAILGNTASAYNQVWHLPTDQTRLTGRQWIELFANEMKVKPRSSVLPVWMIRLIGIFVPFMRELPEMMYQYEQDYVFDSSKFEKAFHFQPTKPAEGVKRTVETS
ncbi:NAD-dependent epimerase/dehydratase family protein [Larkinella terrae]|uniref:NAD-dependent epimerase/dehydratase family protein n=1 Tax=Larkinella terrae TaxID=2025311 RepID=A0A7K0EMR5_9BACT|nr:NAD-dependent epimerase/dehydratase family protein [Larkinella terrae]MRS63002.1 NAD-dependent epimerase/dehydratase family protein [Larkinella terrae]